MHKTFHYFCIVILLFVTASCQVKIDNTVIVDDESCVPPCWNRIYPGETEYQQAKKILLDTQSVEQDSIEESVLQWQGFDNLYWKMDKDVNGTLYSMNGLVMAIDFVSEQESFASIRKKNLVIKNMDVVNKFGQPEIVQIGRFYNGFSFTGIYPEKGFAFSYIAYRNIFNTNDNLPEKGRVYSVVYFEPSSLPILIEKAGWFVSPDGSIDDFYNDSYDWNGFGNIDEKYPAKENK